jgi:hypothetical protein
MRNAIITQKNGLNKWARGIGNFTAETEMAIMDAKADFTAKVRRLRSRQQKILKKLAAQHQANHRALNEFRAGIIRASADLTHAYRSAIRQVSSPSAQKSMRAKARKRRG